MRYNAHELLSPQQILGRLQQLPLLQNLLTALDAKGLSTTLFGGAVRDLLTFGEISGDLDMHVELREGAPELTVEEFENCILNWSHPLGLTVKPYRAHHITLEHNETGRIFELHYPGKALIEKLSRASFSISAIGFDCGSAELIDPFNGLKDLKEGTLKVLSPEYTVSNAPDFPRMFRIACKLGLPLKNEIEELLKRYGRLISLHQEKVSTTTLIELLKFLSLPNISGYLVQFSKWGLLTSFFPELVALQWTKEGTSDLLSLNLAYAESLDTSQHTQMWESLLDTNIAPFITTRGYLRIAILFHNIGQAYNSLGNDSAFTKNVAKCSSSQNALRLQNNFINNVAGRFKSNLNFMKLIKDIGPLLELADSLKDASSDSIVELFKKGRQTYPLFFLQRAAILATLCGTKHAKEFQALFIE